MSLQDRLDAFKADFEGPKAPARVVEVVHRATAALITSGQAGRALQVSARAPEFELPDSTGRLIRSADLSARGPLVITGQVAHAFGLRFRLSDETLIECDQFRQ